MVKSLKANAISYYSFFVKRVLALVGTFFVSSRHIESLKAMKKKRIFRIIIDDSLYSFLLFVLILYCSKF